MHETTYVMNICDEVGNNSSTVERKTSARVTREGVEGSKAETSDSTFTDVPITLGAEKQFKLFVFLLRKHEKPYSGFIAEKKIIRRKGKHFFRGRYDYYSRKERYI